jgi:hypothetical protein
LKGKLKRMKNLFTLYVLFALTCLRAQNDLHSHIKFNVLFSQEEFKCENNGCRRNFKVSVPNKLNSIDKGRAEYVLNALTLISYNAIKLVQSSQSNGCNNLNYRECSFVKTNATDINLTYELDYAEYQNDINTSASVALAYALVEDFIFPITDSTRLYLKRIENEDNGIIMPEDPEPVLGND